MRIGGWSIELSTTGLLKAGSASVRLLPMLPVGTRVYLPALPGDPPDAIERALVLLRRECKDAVVPVPHVAASRVESKIELEQQLCAWQRASKDSIEEALIVRGDPQRHHGNLDGGSGLAASHGPFGCSLDLLQSGVLQGAGVRTVSLCGHPEGVGELSRDAASDALLRKLHWAEASSMKARIVTQFCFSTAKTIEYAELLRSLGVVADLHVGVVGPCSPEIRMRMANRCAVAPPDAEDATMSKGADGRRWPSTYVRALADWQAGLNDDAGRLALHVYPFGGLESTLNWLQEGDIPSFFAPLQTPANTNENLYVEDSK